MNFNDVISINYNNVVPLINYNNKFTTNTPKNTAIFSINSINGLKNKVFSSGTLNVPTQRGKGVVNLIYGKSEYDFSDSQIYNNDISNPYSQQEMLNSLKSIKNLNNNWNGYGAKKFDKSFVCDVEDKIIKLKYFPWVNPTADNSIQFEFEKENNDYLEFLVKEDDRNKVNVFSIVNNEEKEEIVDFDVISINKIIKDFIDKNDSKLL